MKLEEAIKFLNTIARHILSTDFGFKDADYSIDLAIDALEKQIKFRWHDLRLDPTDLPQEDTVVDIVYCLGNVEYGCNRLNYRYSSARYIHSIHDGYVWSDNFGYYNNVIAWREIEPYEENER